MGKDSEDKAERVLSIYTRLKQGKIIFKDKESAEYHVAPRTIQRDISDIQCFLQNENVKTGEVQEVVFDKKAGGYILQTKNNNQLEGKEILATIKILLESRALMKNELFPIIHKMLGLCSDDLEAKLAEDLLRNEMHHYVELRHGKMLLNRLWQLEQAVKNQQYIRVKYQRLKNKNIVTRKLKPVGVMFSEFYFYLTAYIDDIDKNERFENPDDTYPTIYRIDRFLEIEIIDEHFAVPYSERFEEGEFRKRVQFMYGGTLRKIRFKYMGDSLDVIFDRVPTAEIIKEDKDGVIFQAETFGKGIEMWIRSQGDLIKQVN